MNWEYKILEFSTEVYNLGKDKGGADSDIGITESVRFRKVEQKEVGGLFGGKIKRVASTLTTDKIETIFNDLGNQGWELCETIPLITNTVHAFRHGTRTTSVQFIFKRRWGGKSGVKSIQPKMVTVVLKDVGTQEIQIIKLLRELTGLGFRESKKLCDNVPSIIKEDISQTEAEELKEQLQRAGGVIELK